MFTNVLEERIVSVFRVEVLTKRRYKTTQSHNPEDHSRHLHRRENLKSHISYFHSFAQSVQSSILLGLFSPVFCSVFSVQYFARSVQSSILLGLFSPVFCSVCSVQYFARSVQSSILLGLFSPVFCSVCSVQYFARSVQPSIFNIPQY
jgi:hypothetical protein